MKRHQTPEQRLIAEYVGFVDQYGQQAVTVRHWLQRFRMADRTRLWQAGAEPPWQRAAVFRGVSGPKAAARANGLSWSLSLNVACWFATRRREPGAAVYVAVPDLQDIFCMVQSPAEQEMIAYPSEFYRLDMTVAQMRRRAARYVREANSD